jgi:hypothetical protein
MASQAPTFPYPIPSACQGDLMNLNAAIHKFNVVLANAQRLCDYNPFF